MVQNNKVTENISVSTVHFKLKSNCVIYSDQKGTQ